ncbi:MAG TPA: hypothetical protein VIV11_20985 [Kofleriaceae bacterium]
MRKHMSAHFGAAVELQAAIVHGRLGEARDTARWFATHDMDVPVTWRPYVDEMRDSAMRITRARDVESAGVQIGRLGRACSACHEAQHARPAFAYTPAPLDDATLEAQMVRHQWAAARLWEGLVGPADQLWDEGARVMATSQLDIAKSGHAKPNADVAELAERLREQTMQAIATTDRTARAALFGEMMGTCASCHSIVRPAPVVGARRQE